MTAAPAKPPRLLSLDVFRGLTILLMIVVNTQGEGAPAYPVLVHADWFGFTAADLVFPSFLFAMGAALAFSGRTKTSEATFWMATLRRIAIIFGLGVLMYWFPFAAKGTDGHWSFVPFSDTRLMGVLQRLALCYAATAIAARYLGMRGVFALGVGLLAAYWAILRLGAPGPEGLTKAGNFGNLVDLAVLGKSHLYRWDDGFEPEGLLGTLPATVNCLAGFLTARALTRQGPQARLLCIFAGLGAVFMLAALALSPVVPIGKKLWTPTFVALTVGIDLVVLALIVWALDVKSWRWGAWTLEALGRNPLVVYLFSELFVVVLGLIPVGTGNAWSVFCREVVMKLAPGSPGALTASLAYALVCWLPAWALYRKGIVIRV